MISTIYYGNETDIALWRGKISSEDFEIAREIGERTIMLFNASTENLIVTPEFAEILGEAGLEWERDEDPSEGRITIKNPPPPGDIRVKIMAERIMALAGATCLNNNGFQFVDYTQYPEEGRVIASADG